MTVSGLSLVATRTVSVTSYLFVIALLSPIELGIVTLGLSFYGLVSLFRDFGLTPAIVSKGQLDDEDISSAFTIRILIAGIIVVIGVVSGLALPLFFKMPALRTAILLGTLAVFVEALGFLSNALLLRSLKFGKLALIDILSAIVMATGAVVVALSGFPLLAIFVGMLVSSTARTIMLLIAHPASTRISKKGLRESHLLSFGGKLVVTSATVYGLLNLNVFVLGKIDASSLGFYGLAFLWASTPSEIASSSVSRVMLPTYSALLRIGDSAFDAFARSLRYLLIGSLPMFIALLFLSPSVIHLVYGSVWNPSIPILMILLLFGLFRLLLEPAASLLLSYRKPGQVLVPGLALFGLMSLFVFPVASEYGAVGCAYLLTAVYLVFTFILWVLAAHQFRRGFIWLLRIPSIPTVSVLVGVALGIPAMMVLPGVEGAIVAFTVAVSGYVGTLYVIARQDLLQAWEYVRCSLGVDRKRSSL